MVSFTAMGRAGNFLFQAATAWAYAKRHGLEFSTPKSTTHDFWSPLYLHHLQHPNYSEHLPRMVIREQAFHYNELPFDEEWRHQNILLNGYFQSPKYFDEYRDEMLNAFNLPWTPKHDTCSIHARYGDYLTIEGKHILIDEQYLCKAMAIIMRVTGVKKFKVFSDDIPLFKQKFDRLYPFEYSTNTDIMQDLIEISCCAHNIGSSSTFSWWGAYLNRNPNKIIITQELWFQPGWDNADTKDLIPSEWIKL